MPDLFEQSKRLLELQAELEKLKNGADTIQEFSASALQAMDFISKMQSEHAAIMTAISALQMRIAELEGALAEDNLQATLNTITHAASELDSLNPQLSEMGQSIVETRQGILSISKQWEKRVSTQNQKLEASLAEQITAAGRMESTLTGFSKRLEFIETDTLDRLTALSGRLDGLNSVIQGNQVGNSGSLHEIRSQVSGIETKVATLHKNLSKAYGEQRDHVKSQSRLMRFILVLMVILSLLSIVSTVMGPNWLANLLGLT
jgi:chromosome segregation ATPase